MQNKPVILVAGANGQLGNVIRAMAAKAAGFHFTFVSREEFSIDDKHSMELYFASNRIDYVINCAAYTQVDKAETEKEKAFLINGTAVGDLAQICNAFDTTLIHLSTDYVYTENSEAPLQETDPTLPGTVYGQSKLLGEQLALQNHPSSVIIRTSWVYSEYGVNFVKTMLQLFDNRKEIEVVSDQEGSPTYAVDLVSVIFDIIRQMEAGREISGIFNYCNDGMTNWYEFAQEIKRISESSVRIKPVFSHEYATLAKRPLYSVMDTSKIKRELDIDIPNWKDSLQKMMHSVLKGVLL